MTNPPGHDGREGPAGRLHSFQSLAAVDGPGLRAAAFLQGCPLRCVYCHNPDTWDPDPPGAETVTAEALAQRFLRYKPYFGAFGGATVSGGEPLFQATFVADLFLRLRHLGIHTVLDTAGCLPGPEAAEVLRHTDLVLCDLKFATEEDYRRYTGGSLASVIRFMDQAEALGVPLRIRHVVVPGLTDRPADLKNITALAQRRPNLESIEFLPFRKTCAGKYAAMGIPFPAGIYEECTRSALEESRRNALSADNASRITGTEP